MKFFSLIASLVLSFSVYSFESKGLHKLNPFPLKPFVSRSFFKYENYEINLKKNQTSTNQIEEYHGLLEQELGYRLTDSTYFSFAMSHGKSKLSSLRSGDTNPHTYTVTGFSEPRFSIFSRRKWSDGLGEPVIDVSISIIPSLGDRKVGTRKGNRLNGRNVIFLEVSHAAFYNYWDFNLNFDYKYYGDGEEKNLINNHKKKFSSYSESEISFEAQNYISDTYFIRAGIGLRLITDQEHYDGNDTSTIQQGTGSSHFIGLVRKSDNFVVIMKLMRQKNDYFIKSASGNRESDYIFKTVSLEVLKEF